MQTQPTLAQMLDVLHDSVTDSKTSALEICSIAKEIVETHGTLPYTESLRGLDPFHALHNRELGKPSQRYWPLRLVTTEIAMAGDWRETIAEIDGALFRLSNSGYAHKI